MCDDRQNLRAGTTNAANLEPLWTPSGRKCPNSQFDWCKHNFREDSRGVRCANFDPCDTTRGDGDGEKDANGRPCAVPDADKLKDLEADREAYFKEASL